MAEDGMKTAREAAIELVKSLRADLELRKADTITINEHEPKQVAAAIGVAIREQIAAYEAELVKMRKAETCKSLHGIPSSTPSTKESILDKAKPAPEVVSRAKNITADALKVAGFQSEQPNPSKPRFTAADLKEAKAKINVQKTEVFIDKKNASDSERRYKVVGQPESAKGPLDKKPLKVKSEGSGGELKKEDMPASKSPVAPTTSKPKLSPKAPALKPAGVPGMKSGSAPKAPAPPGAPGQSGSVQKEELEKVMGGPGKGLSVPGSQRIRRPVSSAAAPTSPPAGPPKKIGIKEAFPSFNAPEKKQ